ncbi:MAG: hypothetical protein U0T81_10340 [Saprospiraceae bacterium]
MKTCRSNASSMGTGVIIKAYDGLNGYILCPLNADLAKVTFRHCRINTSVINSTIKDQQMCREKLLNYDPANKRSKNSLYPKKRSEKAMLLAIFVLT